MSRHFQPKGLTIYTRSVRRGGIVDRHYEAGVKSKGRTGAKTRARFIAADKETQANALHEWANGRAVSL